MGLVRASASVMLLVACYRPDPSPGAPCSSLGGCPSGLRCVAGTCTDDEMAPPDATDPDGPSCVLDGIDLCASTPMSALTFVVDTTIDTTGDPICTAIDPAVCLIDADQITIASTARVIAIGNRPLVLVARGSLFVQGALDVSSTTQRQGAAANAATCGPPMTIEIDLGGAGGGAGGSFSGNGGNGGTGDTDQSLGGDGTSPGGVAGAAVAAPGFARGGCPGGTGGHESATGGQGGVGGASGGALRLIAGSTLEIAGTVSANGAGGAGGAVQAGGGGGGSGGFIRIASPSITIDGIVAANGGGGGEGGSRPAAGMDIAGNPGADGTASATPAPGGTGASPTGGNGGDGSARELRDGANGQPTNSAGGGGGGGAGFIILSGSRTGSGVISPPT